MNHNWHCLITAGGIDWRIVGCSKNRIFVRSWIPTTSPVIVTIDTTNMDWDAYCTTAARWDYEREIV